MSEKLPISVTMLVKNSEKYLPSVLQALSDFDEIVLLDNGSTDRTLEIAKEFSNTSIYHHPFIGFGPMKNLAADCARNDWIINIDSDEVFPDELIAELKTLTLDDHHNVYAMLRLNHYRGKLIKSCGWYPDWVERLYNKRAVHFNNKQVHESLELNEQIDLIKLNSPFRHYSFDSATSLINKMQQYTSLFAEQNKYKKRASVPSAVSHGISAFLKNYLLKKGILEGASGLTISAANAMGSYYKYIKLYEANRSLTCSLIITTYNRPDALAAVLESVLHQTELPNEVIIADDGSGIETQQVVEYYQANFPVPLKHCWQEDAGFRLAESRNRALAQTTSEYVVMIDGDMIMHPKFIADHKINAELGVFIQGGRIILPEAKTDEILSQPSQYPRIRWYQKGIEKRFEKRFSTCHIPCLTRLLRKKKSSQHKGIRGCNMAFFLKDAIQVNGFNNEFIGWGREDSEFVERLYNAGVKRADIRFSAIAYHLWHDEAQRDALPHNDFLLTEAQQNQLHWCENGLHKFIQKREG